MTSGGVTDGCALASEATKGEHRFNLNHCILSLSRNLTETLADFLYPASIASHRASLIRSSESAI